jgi:hypothetical protein
MHRVVIVGRSLFADTLSQMVADSNAVVVAGHVASLEDLPLCIAACKPDAILVADSCGEYLSAKTYLHSKCELPVIYTTLKDDHFTLFTSQRIKAAQSQLFSAIAALPKQS